MPDISRLVIEVDSKGVLTATGNLEVFSRMGHKTGKETDDMAKSFGAFQLVVNKLPGPLKSVASGLMGMVDPATMVVSTFLEVGEAAVQFVKKSIKAFADFEMIKTNLEVVMGSAEQASKTFREIQTMAGRTPFNVDQLAEAATMLRQTGVSARDLIPTLEMLGNVSGGSAEKFSRISLNYAQIQSTMKATSMDLRQFAMAGLPIYKMLDEIGVRGTASADDIEEAFRRMTSEGGTFFNAMEKGAATLQGKITNLEGVWKSYTATWTETTGLGNFIKDFMDVATKSVVDATNKMNNEVKFTELRKKIDEGYNTLGAQVEFAEEAIKALESFLETANTSQKLLYSAEYGQYIAYYKEFLEQNRAYIDLRDENIARENEFNAALEKTTKDYRDLQKEIDEYYSKTEAGKKEAETDEIEMWKKRLTETHLAGFDKYGKQTDDKSQRSYYDWALPTEEERNKILAIIKMIEEGPKKGREELLQWQKIFKQAMNLSETDTKQSWFTKQATSITQFTSMLEDANDRAEILHKTLGTETAGTLEQAASAWEELASQMIMSGEWQEDSPLFLDVLEKAKEAKETLGEANLDKLIQDTNNELGLLRLTSDEMEKQKLMAEYQVDNENKITEALASQKLLRSEQSRLGIISGATGLSEEKIAGLDSESIFNQFTDAQWGKLKDALKLAQSGIGDYFSAINEYEKSFEELYRTVSSSEYVDVIKQKHSAMIGTDMGDYLDNFDKYMAEINDSVEGMITRSGEGLETARGFAQGARFSVKNAELEKTRDLLKEYDAAYEEQIKLQEYTDTYGEGNAEKIIALEQEIEKTRALIDALRQLKEAGLQLTASHLVDFANSLGEAFRDGSISGDEFSGAIKNMLKSLIDAMPQLLLNVGLQLLAAKQWALGLAFIGASGLMSFVSGLTGDAEKNNRNDEAERLRKIQEQISSLIESQRKQQEYYLTQKRKVDSTAVSVNDAIITPRGTVYTHPEDYIIATKTPETLMGSGGANVVVNIINNSGARVSQQETTNADGLKEIQVTIDKIVQNGISSGRYDGAFNAMNAKNQGRKVMS